MYFQAMAITDIAWARRVNWGKAKEILAFEEALIVKENNRGLAPSGASQSTPPCSLNQRGYQGTSIMGVGDGAPSRRRDSNQSPPSYKDVTIANLNKNGKAGQDSNPLKSSTPNKAETEEPSKVATMTPSTVGRSADPSVSDSSKFDVTGEDSLVSIHPRLFNGPSSGENQEGYKNFLSKNLFPGC